MIINITGVDGCGKGTQLARLADYLLYHHHRVFMSKAYGPAEKELFAPLIELATPAGVMFIFQAMHAEQAAKARRALDRGEVVLADRWDDSYEAFHSQKGILASDPVLRHRLNEIAFDGLRADITIFLRVPVLVAMERCRVRGADFFDLKGEAYHQMLADRMEELAIEQDWYVIDGELPHGEVHRRVLDIVLPLLAA